MVNLDPKPLKEATKIAHADLRGPTREQVEKMRARGDVEGNLDRWRQRLDEAGK